MCFTHWILAALYLVFPQAGAGFAHLSLLIYSRQHEQAHKGGRLKITIHFRQIYITEPARIRAH